MHSFNNTSTPSGADEQAPRLTIDVAAKALRLPSALLYRLNVEDHPEGGLIIPYRAMDGRESSRLHRRSLADLTQPTDPARLPYGLDRLERAHRQGRLVLVANEIDCWTLWWCDIPALGLPGDAALLTAECVEGLPSLFVHQAPHAHGASFVAAVLQRLSSLGFNGSVHALDLPFEALGPSAPHVRDPGQCRALLHARLSAAPTLRLPAPLSPTAGERGRGEGETPPQARTRVFERAGSGPEDSPASPEAPLALAVREKCEGQDVPAAAVPLSPVARERGRGEGAPPVRWLCPGRIPLGLVTMLDGDPGLGKSCVALDLAARLTRGQAMPFAAPDTALPSSDVVILSAEDTRDVVLSRLAAAGADCPRAHVVRPSLDDFLPVRPPSPDDDRMLLPRHLPRLRDLLVRTNARLLIIDPFIAFLDPSVHWHMDQSMRRLLLVLAQIAEDLGIAILLIRHLNKQSHLKVIYRGSGAIALIGNARAGLLVVQDPDHPDQRLLVAQKSNLGPTPPAACYLLRSAADSVQVAWQGELRLDISALVNPPPPPPPEESHAIAEAMAFLQENLRHCAIAAKYLIRDAKCAGISEKTLRRAKFKLGIISRVWPYGVHPGERWSWELPEKQEQTETPR